MLEDELTNELKPRKPEEVVGQGWLSPSGEFIGSDNMYNHVDPFTALANKVQSRFNILVYSGYVMISGNIIKKVVVK